MRENALNAAKGQAAFAKLLVESAGKTEPGLTFMRGFRTERGRINLKKTGLFGMSLPRERWRFAIMWSSALPADV